MSRFHPPLIEWLRTHHGVVSHAELLVLGCTPSMIHSLLSTGELIRVHEGVYRHALWPVSFLNTCAAACAADPSIVITCGGAARLRGLRRSRHAGLHAICTGTTVRITEGLVVHRTKHLPAAHIEVRTDGIRVTTTERAIFDLSRHLADLDLESVIEQAIDRKDLDIASLHAIGMELCVRGRAGATRFTRVLASRPVWREAADSHPEVVLRDALDAIGVHLTPQVPVDLGGGVEIHPDLGDATHGFYVEIDHHEWHGTREAIERDRRRDRRLRLRGDRVERVGTDEIERHLGRVVGEISAAYRQHLATRRA